MPINFFKYINLKNDDNVVRIEVPKILEDFVEGFYMFDAKKLDGKQLFFNDGYPVLAFMSTKNEKTIINVAGTTKEVGNPWLCGGLIKNTYCNSSVPFQNMLVVRFYPMTFFKLFGISDSSFEKEQVFEFSKIAGSDYEEFNNTYYQSSSLDNKIGTISDFLIKRIDSHSYPKLITDIIDFIDRESILTVKDLLNIYKGRLNYKWLERNFKKHLGISPKNYLLIKRFLKAYIDLQSHNSRDLLQIAIDHGYYDENHFIKDFRKFSGVPPKTYFQNNNFEI